QISPLSLHDALPICHFDVAKGLIPIKGQSNIFAHIKLLLNELEDVLHGVFLLRELSLRTRDLIMSFGERLSAYIIHEYLKQVGLDRKSTRLNSSHVK